MVRDKTEKELDVIIGELPKDTAKLGRGMEKEEFDAYKNVFANIKVENVTPDITRQLELPSNAKGCYSCLY